MTDRIRTLTVILDRDIRKDEVQAVTDALRMVRYVADVQPGPAVDMEQHAARHIAWLKMQQKLIDFIRDELGNDVDLTL